MLLNKLRYVLMTTCLGTIQICYLKSSISQLESEQGIYKVLSLLAQTSLSASAEDRHHLKRSITLDCCHHSQSLRVS